MAPLAVCSPCQGNKNEDDARACGRLAEADRDVAKASKTLVPNERNDFERGLAAARKCGGVAPERATAAGCDPWRTAVKRRAKACTALEARKPAEPPKPAAGVDESNVPVIRIGAAEQVAPAGVALDLTGAVGTLKNVPSVRVNGKPVELIETPSTDTRAGPVSRSFKISVPTAKSGTDIYVIVACDGADTCFGRDLVVRVVPKDGSAAKGQN